MPVDYQNDWSAGQNNGITPFLSTSSYFQGVNMHARNGYLANREPDVEVRLTSAITGRFQGSAVYAPATGERIVAVTDGRIYEIWPNGSVNEILGPDGESGPLSTTAERCFFEQANDYLIIQDGINLAVVVEDAGYTVSETVPIGKWMASGNGYLTVVSPNGRTVFVSNVSTFLDDPDIILEFTEQPGSLTPFGVGGIVGMRLAPVLDSGTEMGALLVFGSNGRVFGYDLTVPRDEWATTIGFGRVVAEGLFLASNNSIQAIGGDLYMRTTTGLDTLNLARADWRSSRNRSISLPIEGWLRTDQQHLLHVCDSAFWNNRYYVTTAPRTIFPPAQIIHDGVAVYDVAHGLSAEPAYPGVERGTHPVSLHVVDGCLMTLSKGPDGGLRLFRRLPQSGSKSSPEWKVETRAFDWGAPHRRKTLKGVESFAHVELRSSGKVEVDFRTDSLPGWQKWTDIEAQAQDGPLFQRQSDKFPLPGLPEITIGDRSFGNGFHWVQLRFRGSIPVRIREIGLEANIQESPITIDVGRVSQYIPEYPDGIFS